MKKWTRVTNAQVIVALLVLSVPLVERSLAAEKDANAGAAKKSTWTPPDDSWVRLFNGQDLTGWKPPEGKHSWRVVDGVIDYEAQGGNLTSEQEFGDYQLHLEWRFKRTAGKPYRAKLFNPDGTQKKDNDGKPMFQDVANADSGIFLRGRGNSQANLWCWPCGSGQLWAFHSHKDPDIRRGALPIKRADRPVGEWNEMEITMKGEQATIVLNGTTVIDNAYMPGIGARGPLVLQHHGGYNEKTKQWNSASALVQFRNIWLKRLED